MVTEILNPGNTLIAARVVPPCGLSHDDLYLIDFGELSVGADIDYDLIDARAAFTKNMSDNLGDIGVIERVGGDKHSLPTRYLVVALHPVR